MKKQFYTLAALLVMGITANAQVGIGTVTPDASSMLDIKSTTAGFLMPRMTTANRTAIASPAAGLQVFDTTTNTIWFFDGTAWVNSGGTATNIYTSNGTLSGNRSVNMADKNLQFNSTTGTFVINTAAGTQAFTQTGAGVFGIDAPNVSNGRFVVLENGNVGIGKTLPAYNLSIVNNGTATSIGGGAVTNNALNISNPTGGRSVVASMSAFTTGGVAKEIYLGINPNLNSDAGTFTLTRNAGGVDMTMDLSNGNVGIGVGAPGNKLHVTSASASTSGIRMTNLTNTVTTKTANAATLGVDANGDIVIASNAASTAAKNFIYMPSIAIDVSANVTGATKNLYSLYSAQFTTPKAASTGAPAAIPVLPAATDFYYYVTYADPAVFTGAMTIDASGVLTYNVTASAVTDATFINIVLVPKN